MNLCAKGLLLLIFLLSLSGLVSAATVTLNSPANDANISSSVTFNCSANSTLTPLSNMTLYGNWTGTWTANETKNLTGTANSTLFVKNIPEGSYSWNCLATDSLGISSFASSNRTFNVDKTPPTISSVLFNETYLCGTASLLRVNCTATDSLTGVKNVTINANSPEGVYNYSASLLSGNTYYADISLNRTGFWNFTCIAQDYAGNIANKTSGNIEVYYSSPDLTLSSKDINFNNSDPKEKESVLINATIHNDGCQNANNFLTGFYIGDPSSGGISIGNQTISVPQRSNATASITWPAVIGPSNIWVFADANNTISEGNESNNKANRTINVNAWQTFYGNVTDSKTLGNSASDNMTLWFNGSISTGIIFVTDKGSTIHWNDLFALGRTTSEAVASDDFANLDTLFNMTNFNDSIANKFTTNGQTPRETQNFTIQSRKVPYVPVINSTNNTNFVTGILWDSYYDTDGQFDTTDKEPVVFATKINQNAQGAYGKYDYEITIPVNLRDQSSAGSSEIYFYYELS